METFKKCEKQYRDVYLCRACLTATRKLTALTSTVENSDLTVYEMLQNISPFEMYSPDVSGICTMCLSLLKIAYDFKLQLERSEQTLRERDPNFIELPEKGDEEVEIEIQAESEAPELVPEPEPVEESSGRAVELICGNNKYDLRNVVIVEEEIAEEHNYAGFLDKLGKEITAEFVKDRPEPVVKSVENEISLYINMPETGPSANQSGITEENAFFDQSIFEPGTFQSSIFGPSTSTSVQASKRRAKRSYQCELCGFVTHSDQANRYHALKHKGPRYHCQLCPDKGFILAYKLTNHMKVFHKGEKWFLCPICGKEFSHHTSLDYHIKVHKGERNFVCELCGAKFFLSSNLTRHMLTHTKARPYKCKYCDKAYPAKTQRTLHENTHLNIKPHKCKYCGKAFNRTSNLKYHYMTHAGTFTCTLCPKSFMEAKFLKTHLRRTHKITYYEES